MSEEKERAEGSGGEAETGAKPAVSGRSFSERQSTQQEGAPQLSTPAPMLLFRAELRAAA